MKISITLSFLIALVASPALAQTQATPGASQNQTEVAGEYTYAHSNAPPAACGCFSLSGGSASAARSFGPGYWGFVVDTTFLHASGISSASYDLTLSVFTAGIRLRPAPQARWSPFGQVLLGAEHAGGSLVKGNTPAATDPAIVFAMNIGGGLDRRLGRRWSLRLVEADYLMTQTSNGVNDLQNNLRLSSGLAYRFGK